MDKKIILKNYLNTINLGNNTLGVKAAALRYFDKDVSDLTLSEATVIAGITQNPSRFNPLSENGRKRNEEKRRVILQYMYEQGMISKDDQEEALADDVYSRIKNVDIVTKETQTPYSYFTDELIDQVLKALQDKKGYTETQAYNLLFSGGLEIHTTQDPDIQSVVDEEISRPENYDVVYYSIDYRLSIQHPDQTTTNYSDETLKTYFRKELGETNFDGLFSSKEKADEAIAKYKAAVTKDGDTVLGESVHYVLQPQASFVLIDQSSGYVKALSGGRGQKEVSRSLNRATNTLRQPGSTFKVITSFAPAIDTCGATLGSVYYDGPYTMDTKTFRNWYSSKGYMGYSTIRDGIVYSMNIVAVRCMIETGDTAARRGIREKLRDHFLNRYGLQRFHRSRRYHKGRFKPGAHQCLCGHRKRRYLHETSVLHPDPGPQRKSASGKCAGRQSVYLRTPPHSFSRTRCPSPWKAAHVRVLRSQLELHKCSGKYSGNVQRR